jgi:hypothetical protein
MSVWIGFLQLCKIILEFETPREVHDLFWINLGLNPAKPCQISAIHVLQWCTEKGVIHIHGCIGQVLPVRKCDIVDRLGAVAQRIGHRLVKRAVGPLDAQDGWEESAGAVRRVRGWTPMREEARSEGLHRRGNSYRVV